jgi:hypothetical protein
MIVFQNAGLIDIAAVTTMGVSVKEAGSIGFFGTGLKFSIATILRLGGTVTVWRGMEPHVFTTERTTIRGEDFDLVSMNGTPLGFTTQLGRTWLPWMAFRELASNCRDEGGRYWLFADDGQMDASALPLDGHTTITVDCEAIADVWPDRHTIMLESDPLHVTEAVEVHEGVSRFVYYRGVRVFQAPRPLAFTYNIRERLELTEDRTAKNWWDVELKLERGIGAIEDHATLRRMLTCGELFQEHHMNVPQYGQPGPAFREMARQLVLGPATEPRVSPAVAEAARATAIADMEEGDSIQLEPARARMLERATAMLEEGGFNVSGFPVIVCETLGAGIHGLAKDGKIFLSLLPFQKGTRELAATLLEEFAHLKSGEGDCTRGFQNWLFDQLLIQAERAAGEPF